MTNRESGSDGRAPVGTQGLTNHLKGESSGARLVENPLGRRMSDFTIDIDVDAPQQTVFAYLTDGTRTPERYESIRKAIKTSEGSIGKGTRFTFTRVLPQGEVANEVEISEFREPDVVTFAGRTGPTPFVYRFRLQSDTGWKHYRRRVEKSYCAARSVGQQVLCTRNDPEP